MQRITFIVEEAGCASCATRVRAALEPFGAVDEIRVDEEADAATVVLHAEPEGLEASVQHALDRASAGAGHGYRVRPGSWTTAGSR